MHLYAFGSNSAGQLGIGSTDDTHTPQICLFTRGSELPGNLVKIAAGGNHTLLLFADGSVYFSGKYDDSKETSLAKFDSSTIFKSVCLPDIEIKVKLCSAFWSGSVFVTEDKVYAIGLGSKGETGITESFSCPRLHPLANFPSNDLQDRDEITDIASGVDFNVTVQANGEVWGWGNGRKGQLDHSKQIVTKPRKFQSLDFPVVRAACGREFSYLVGENGSHAILGSEKYDIKSQAPASVPGWKDVDATWGSIFVLKSDGKVLSWGRNDHGQLAPPQLPDIKYLTAGSEHVVALTRSGKVISWGWGEHGNCGVDIDVNGDVKGKWNEIPIDKLDKSESVSGIGAGCATSFFWSRLTKP